MRFFVLPPRAFAPNCSGPKDARASQLSLRNATGTHVAVVVVVLVVYKYIIHIHTLVSVKYSEKKKKKIKDRFVEIRQDALL